jgi:PleD family two-component response regulator
LRLCGQIRSLERTRHVPILLVADPGDNARLLRGLDLGVNDYLVRTADKNEMVARVRTRCGASATRNDCATTCSIRWRWRSPIR